MTELFHIQVTTDASTASFLPRIAYILDALNSYPINWHWQLEPLLEQPAVCVHYGVAQYRPNVPHYFVPALPELIGAKPPFHKCVSMNTFTHESGLVYGIELGKNNSQQAFFEKNKGLFGFDWIASLFFLFSRIEEYAPENTDDIGIMPGENISVYKAGVHHRPIADELVAALAEIITGKRKQQHTILTTSHDVDTLTLLSSQFNLLRYLAGSALRYKTVRQWPGIIRDYIRVKTGHQADPADTFDWLFEHNNTAGKYLFLGAGGNTPFDHFPDLNLPRMRAVREKALQNGYQIGLHPSFDTWKNEERWLSEKQHLENWLGQPVLHCRQHYLRFSFPETADILEKAGIETDSTLGFRRHIGFRCGTGFPFHLYHFGEERAYRWKEIPLVIMDIALLRETGFQARALQELWANFFKNNRFNTQINLNFHNPGFYEPELAGVPLLSLYQQATSCAPFYTSEPI